MSIDMEIVRQILLAIDEEPRSLHDLYKHLPAYDSHQIAEYTKQLWFEAFITGIDISAAHGFDLTQIGLTWRGQEMLANAKNMAIWGQARKIVAGSSSPISLHGLQWLLTELAIRRIQERP